MSKPSLAKLMGLIVASVCALALIFGVITLPHLSAHAAGVQSTHAKQAQTNIISVTPNSVSDTVDCKMIELQVSGTSTYTPPLNVCPVIITGSHFTNAPLHWSTSVSSKMCVENYPCTTGTNGVRVVDASGSLTTKNPSAIAYLLFPNVESGHATIQGTVTFQGPSNRVTVKFLSTYYY